MISDPRIRVIPAQGDGSCFFHSICNSVLPHLRDEFAAEYQRKHVKDGSLGLYVNRKLQEFGRMFRNQLADQLPFVYDSLSRGSMRENAKTISNAYSLENMQQELRGSCSVDTLYVEMISELLKKDIYIIKKIGVHTYQLIPFGDNEVYYKNRDSIVLAYQGDGEHGHYDSIGYVEDDSSKTITLFPTDHPFINVLKQKTKT